MQDKTLHTVEVFERSITIDGQALKGLTNFEIKWDAKTNLPHLVVGMYVELGALNVAVNAFGDYFSGNILKEVQSE